ncbi:hypothetical protein [Vibrio alginolyticus]|uniref:hypothetical protein n=1 Tax=Vibrio alginolyticus TaxID=663 RepID=UPI00211AA136|nr:hypothetical protein [Vibrio alginolyticus]MCQ9090694.1 hypothetical protein [Vibrio alginolyticus]
MKKFLNVFQLPTGYQVRIGKKTKSFNAGVSSDNALNSALSFRLDMYKQGVLPANWNVGYFEPNAIAYFHPNRSLIAAIFQASCRLFYNLIT